MRKILATTIRSVIRPFGIDIVHYENTNSVIASYPSDFTDANVEICDAVKAYTMTSPERVNALIDAVHYIAGNNIKGDMVECGVWKGGSAMAMMLTLMKLRDNSRHIYLYDTFSGMSAPTDIDISIKGENALEKFSTTKITDDSSNWCLSPLDEVKQNVFSTGYPEDKIHFVQGKVEDTIPKTIPEQIALLRLDTDWYESTKHELTYLFPLLQPNGVLIIDDYGHWEGARKAVDEYFSNKNISVLLIRVDDTGGRIAIKTP